MTGITKMDPQRKTWSSTNHKNISQNKTQPKILKPKTIIIKATTLNKSPNNFKFGMKTVPFPI